MCWKKSGELPENRGDVRYNVDLVLRCSWPVRFRKMQKMSPSPRTRKGPCYQMAMESDNEKLEYPDDVKYMVSISKPPEIDKPFDVLSLLSFDGKSNYLVRNNGNGARVELNKDTFKGKDIMVCCFQVPMFRLHDHAVHFQSLADICYEKYNSGKNDFEMVVVVKMSAKANYERVFDHFLSAFPSSCLAVPFNDPKRRDYICRYLDVSHMCKCFIVDSSGIVLYHKYPNFALNFGADAFPFTNCHHRLSAKDKPVWESPSTTQLEQLLGCTASDLVYKVNPDDGSREVVSVSKLKEKVVGLYLLSEGSFMSKLRRLYEECRVRKLEFEIVVVYIPFGDCLDPEAYQRKVDGYMKRHRISWWRMPFNNSKCRRLWRLCEYCCDQLVIVGPHNEYVVPYGREALRHKGVDAYPFRDLCNFKPIT